MTKIIGFLGKKQSGKSTSSNIIHGIELLKRGMIQDYKIVDGKLHVLTASQDGKVDWGEFDILRQDEQFVSWAEFNMWPHVKNYAFADSLKDITVRLFNVPYENVYGTDEQKNTLIEHLRWENMPGVMECELFNACERNHYGSAMKAFIKNCVPHDAGPMTAREFLQFFGTDIMRKIWAPVWVNDTINRILREKSEIAIISDVRFPNEVEAVTNAGGYVAKLYKSTKDLHKSEMGVDSVPKELIKFNIRNNKKGFSLENLQAEIKGIYDNLILS